MDWIRKNPQMGIRDLETFEYRPRQCQVLRVVNGDAKKGIEARQVRTEDEWKDIFRQEGAASRSNGLQSFGGVAVLAARAAEDETDGKDCHDPSVLSKLPFTEATWSHMLEIFHIHGSVARLINRGLSCVFSRSFLPQDISSEPIVVYNCRSPASWPGDLAMSMTWFPERNFWYAVVYGCDPSTEVEISGRLRYSGDAICHPLLIPGIFAELERKRQIKMVKQGSLKLVETVATLHEAHHMPSDAERPRQKPHDSHSPGPDLTANKEVDPWLDIYHKKNGLLNWKDQLNKMVTHAEELNITNFSHDINQSSDINEFRKLMRDTGDRIKERLQDIIREYDERIRDCERNLEGMSLANQMAHTKANMEIASRTKSDSTQMKSIALLTMVFLPATFLATVFSMSFFNWQPESEKGETEVSPRIWIYVVMATGVTILTVLAWLWFIRGRRSWKQRRQSVDEYELSDSQV